MESMKNRFQELERSSTAHIVEVNSRFEVQKKTEVERALRSTANQHQNDRVNLENQLMTSQQKNQEYEQSLRSLSEELDRMAKMNLELKAELDNSRAKYGNIERKNQVEIDQIRIQLESQFRNETVL